MPVDAAQKDQAISTLLGELETVLTAGLNSGTPKTAATALASLPANVKLSDEFKVSLSALPDDVIQLLPPGLFSVRPPTWRNDDLIAFYPFNGDGKDESGNGNHCQSKGAVITSDRFGHENAAMRITLGNYLFNNDLSFKVDDDKSFSFGMWVNVQAFAEGQPYFLQLSDSGFTKDSGVSKNSLRTALLVDGDHVNSFTVDVGGGGKDTKLVAKSVPVINRWYHIFAVFNQRTVTVFVNGDRLKSCALTTDSQETTPTKLIIGHWHFKSDTISDDVRIYSRALSDAEVKELFEYESSPSPKTAAAAPAVAPFDAAQAKALQEAWANHLRVPVEATNSLGMKLKLIPAGEFLMGSNATQRDLESAGFVPEDGFDYSDERPEHKVLITRPFYLGIHEVTRGQFSAFIKETKYQTDAEKDGKGGYGFDAEGDWGQDPKYNWRTFGRSQTDSDPVVNVSWSDAISFCDWLSRKHGKQYRLPTEAEWEYGCRAGSTTEFCFGGDLESLGDYAWHDGNSGNTTPAVGRKRPNAWGLYDMHGNVFEWCADWAGSYPEGAVTDPVGAPEGSDRVTRGGCWYAGAAFCRSAFRGESVPSDRSARTGFRVVCEIGAKVNTQPMPVNEIAPFMNEGLVAFYPFNGNARDESGNGHHGTAIDSKPVTDRHGQAEKAYQFDGIKSHITFPENVFGPDAPEVTVSLWITVDKSSFPFPKPIKILLKGPSNGELALGLLQGKIDFGSRFASNGEFRAASAGFQSESPTCVTGVYRKGTSLQLFLDGSLAAEQSVPNQSLISEPTRKSVRSALGVVLTDSNFAMFKGVVDDLRIYNRALSAAEVRVLYEYESQSPANTAQSPPRAVASVDTIQARTPQNAWADFVQAPVEYTNSVGMKFVILPPGDGPAPAVSTKPSVVKYMGLREVTQAEFQRVTGRNPSEAQGGQLPVEMVTVEDAIVFCANLSDLPEEQNANCVYRLPSDQEWEGAARAGTADSWFFGNSAAELNTFAWHKGNSSLQKTREVALKQCNPWGFFDIYGNVWEWSQEKHLRGGSCRSPAEQCVSTDQKYRAGDRRSDIGFRVLIEKKNP